MLWAIAMTESPEGKRRKIFEFPQSIKLNPGNEFNYKGKQYKVIKVEPAATKDAQDTLIVDII